MAIPFSEPAGRERISEPFLARGLLVHPIERAALRGHAPQAVLALHTNGLVVDAPTIGDGIGVPVVRKLMQSHGNIRRGSELDLVRQQAPIAPEIAGWA